MIAFIKKFLNKLTMYQLMLWYLRLLIAAAVVLSFFDILPYTWWHILLQLAYLIAVCIAANWIFAKIFKTKPHYESQYITAEILALIAGPALSWNHWILLTVLGIVSMASKYLIAWNKRHIFNPAGFAVVFAALFLGQGASWWAGSQYLLPFVAAGGLLLVYKLKWFHITNSFLAAYLLGLIAIPVSRGADLNFVFDVLKITVLNSALLFFTFVMLIEPLTSPAGRRLKIYYGIFAALAILVYQNFLDIYYSFELGLITANLAAFAVSHNPRLNLTFLVRKTIAQNTYLFEFEPMRKFDFIPGQFLEWTVNHKNADAKGTRRFFSIAASPTEAVVRILTKAAVNPSSFKQALLDLKPGDEITASHLEGDFVLSKDKNAKYLFIAGGTGISPFYSMLKYLQDKNEQRDIIIFYTNKTEDEMIPLESKFIPIATDKQGYITPEMIKKEAPDYMERLIYVSGPEPMVEAYEKMVYGMGVAQSKVIRDYFPGYAETYTKES